MTSLESIVLPLEQSRALVEHGIVLETAMVWTNAGQGWWNGGGISVDGHGVVHQIPFVPTGGYADEVRTNNDVNSLCKVLCPAPVLSELLDAIRAAVGGNETTAILSRDKSEAGASCAGIRTEGGKYEIALAPTDLLAAAALLLEVSK